MTWRFIWDYFKLYDISNDNKNVGASLDYEYNHIQKVCVIAIDYAGWTFIFSTNKRNQFFSHSALEIAIFRS